MVVCYNVEGHGNGPLDFHTPTKGSFNLQVLVMEGLRLVEDSSELSLLVLLENSRINVGLELHPC